MIIFLNELLIFIWKLDLQTETEMERKIFALVHSPVVHNGQSWSYQNIGARIVFQIFHVDAGFQDYKPSLGAFPGSWMGRQMQEHTRAHMGFWAVQTEGFSH